MATEFAPPKTARGRAWNHLVHRHRVVRWIDEWWYERAQMPGMAISSLAEMVVLGIGLYILPIPRFIVFPAGRLVAYANEFHTAWLAVRHRSLQFFDQPQTWERAPDGRIRRLTAENGEGLAGDTPEPPRNFVERLKGYAVDFWTERKRIPGFIVSVGSPLLALFLGAVVHVPLIVVGAVTYTTMVAQTIPEVRNGILSVVHRSTSYFNKPQLIPRRSASRTGVDAQTPSPATLAAPAPPSAPEPPQPRLTRPTPPSRRANAPHAPVCYGRGEIEL